MPRLLPATSLVPGPRNEFALSTPSMGAMGGEPQHGGSSAKLVCQNPTGRQLYSLAFINGVAYIETHSLPLAGSVEDASADEGGKPAVIQTKLPDSIASALKRYPPLEIICLDPPSGPTAKLTALVCLYTKKDAFLIELSHAPAGSPVMEGQVTFVREPFDEALLGKSTSTSIVRIRTAPHRRLGYATMCPPTSMAMLTHDSMTNEYSLVLNHGNSVSTPFVYGMEQLDDQQERIMDFCFCQSDEFSLLSSMSILLLKGSGDVMMAGPILFRGTVVPNTVVNKTIEYLQSELNVMDSSTAKWRQYRTAKQFLLDAFPESGRNDYTTALVRTDAFDWPVQMQGPVLLPPESENYGTILASSIEPIPAGDLVGVAIVREGSFVDFGMLSPTTFIPRFKFESEDDKSQLDNDLKWGPIVQRVDLSDENDSLPIISLIPDPIVDSVVHCVSRTTIRSISTNILKVTASKIRQQSTDNQSVSSFMSPMSSSLTPKTTTWSCLDVSNSSTVLGAVVVGDAQLGHVLISRLSNGTLVPVNLTETRHFHEMEFLAAFDEGSAPSKSLSVANQALRAVGDSKPLYELVKPLMQQTVQGLANMGRIVGSSTPTQEITPDVLAVAVSVKERCDNEIALPLFEMSEIVAARRKEMEANMKNQMAQLESLKDSTAKLKETMASIRSKANVARENAQSISSRSSSVLQSSKDLLPKLTQAEYDYYQELQSLDSKTEAWTKEFDALMTKVSGICESVERGHVAVNLPQNYVSNCEKLLDGSSNKLAEHKKKMNAVQDTLDDIAFEVGYDAQPGKPFSPGQ